MRKSVFALTAAVLAAALISPVALADGGVNAAAQSAVPTVVEGQAPVAEPAKREAIQDKRMICTSERTIGSNRMQRVCRAAEQVLREREAAQGVLDKRAVCRTCGGDG